MALRFDDDARTLSCSVRDLVELGFRTGHLSLELVRSRQHRMAEGRAVHQAWQTERAEQDQVFEAEKTLRTQLGIGAWTVEVHGRVDGLTREGDRTVVEELKSVALDHDRLYDTTPDDFAAYTAQLQVYLWILARERRTEPATGRLVLVSVLDGSRHVLGVEVDQDELDARIRRWLGRALAVRDDRIAWMQARTQSPVPWPFEQQRPGQQDIAEHVQAAFDDGRVAMVQAPTGLGKTAPVLVTALRHARATGRQVYWATARTTQQEVAVQTARLLVQAGLDLRVVVITAKDKACLNEVVACRPDACPFAHLHHDKVEDHGVLGRAWSAPIADRQVMRELGASFEVCPYQVAADAARNADLVIGDYNYAFDPDLGGQSLFGESLERWILVVDEAHQLVERARGYGSPAIDGALAERAHDALLATPGYERFAALARQVLSAIDQALDHPRTPWRRGEAELYLDGRPWTRLADSIDEVAADYALLELDRPAFPPGEVDAWKETARAVLRLRDGIDRAGAETVSLGRKGRGFGVRLLCLDPSGFTGPRFKRLGGAVLCSATLSPPQFYKDLLGLGTRTAEQAIPSPFPVEHRPVVVAPRVSTRFKDRQAHAPRTAQLLQDLALAVPGNVAIYTPSFAMLDDLVGRMDLGDRPVLHQRPGASDAERQATLDALRSATEPTVLAAVLGGVFAEGVDLPGGALQAAIIVGPALPPVGLERDLLRAFYEERYGAGYAYASLIPGMTRVVQAAGRVVRGPQDRGVVVLVGQRFRWRDHAALLPEDWPVQVPTEPVSVVSSFFSGEPMASLHPAPAPVR